MKYTGAYPNDYRVVHRLNRETAAALLCVSTREMDGFLSGAYVDLKEAQDTGDVFLPAVYLHNGGFLLIERRCSLARLAKAI